MQQIQRVSHQRRDNDHALRRMVAVAGFVLAGLPLTVLAHSNEYLETITGPHGGKVRMAEQYHFEMVLANGEVRMWVTDHGDNPQSTAGAAGNVKLITDAGIVSVTLAPGGNNALLGKDPKVKPGPATKAIATVTMKGQKPLQTRFAFDAAKKP